MNRQKGLSIPVRPNLNEVDGDGVGTPGARGSSQPGPAEGQNAAEAAAEEGPEDFEQEVRAPRLMKSPAAPTRAEREEHEVTHMPYRTWCPHCVRGRGNNQPHVRQEAKDPNKVAVPTVALDYGFMRTKQGRRTDAERCMLGEEHMSPMLVLKESRHGLVKAMVVPAKGNAHTWIAKRCYQWIEGLGYPKVIIKSDNEPSIVALVKDIMACRAEHRTTEVQDEAEEQTIMDMIPENSEVGESQSNGMVERAVGSIEGMVRTLKSALEDRIGEKIAPTSNALKWLVEHAAYIYNRHKVGPDGKTPYERWKSKQARRPLCEFGEKVLYLPLKGARNGKLEAKFEYGMFVGVLERSGEAVISTRTGCIKARTVKRLVEDSRWKADFVQNMIGTHWAPLGDDKERPVGIRIEMEEPMQPIPEIPDTQIRVKRVTIKKGDLATHGYTEGCRGCNAIRRGEPPANHNEACRRRIIDAINQTPEGATRVKRAVDRANEALAEHLAKRLQTEPNQSENQNKGSSSSGGAAAPTAEESPTTTTTPTATTMEVDAGAAPDPAVTVNLEHGNAASGRSRASSEQTQAGVRSHEADQPMPNHAASSDTDQEEGGPAAKRARLLELSCLMAVNDSQGGELMQPSSDGVSRCPSRPVIAEVYSPPRLVLEAAKKGLKPGWSLDLTTVDEKGNRWDFDRAEDRRHAKWLVEKFRPRVLIGSPMCTAFSALQNWNRRKMAPGKWDAMMRRAVMHVDFCCELYEMQARRGDYFLHEHPADATSWKLPRVQRVASIKGVRVVISDMCCFGMQQVDKDGPGLVKKPTKFMTNSEELAQELSRRCPGGHHHVSLLSGRAASAQVYPKQLCSAVCRAIARQLRKDREIDLHCRDCLQSVEAEIRAGRCAKVGDAVGINRIIHEHAEDGLFSLTLGGCWDDNKGGWLQPELVRKGREEEMCYVRKHRVYDKVPRSQCYQDTGKAPIKTGWAETNKGTEAEPNVRCRWVGKEYNTGPRPELFAPTPPLEGVKIVVSEAASSPHSDTVVAVIDVRRAYFYAKARRKVYVELPEEDWEPGDEDRCGLLRVSLYGTRDAAQNWDEEIGGYFVNMGFVRGKGSTCMYNFKSKGLKAAIHGDDITVTGRRAEVDRMIHEMQDRYEVKVQIMGEAPDLAKEVKILNRTLRWERKGISIEADQRHAREVVEALELWGAQPVATPGAVASKPKDGPVEAEASQGRLEPEKSTTYRAVAARLNYLSQDRPDIKFATMEVCRGMSAPTKEDWVKLKRIGRFLLRRPRAACLFPWQAPRGRLDAFADSDWAGCRETRRSTTGGCVMRGKHCIKVWCKKQAVVALSSAEAELYAALKAAAEGLGVQALEMDMGLDAEVALHLDSTAALSLAHRAGLGKAKHIELQHLWLQEVVRNGRIRAHKVHTDINPADLMTKHLAEERVTQLMHILGYHYPEAKLHKEG